MPNKQETMEDRFNKSFPIGRTDDLIVEKGFRYIALLILNFIRKEKALSFKEGRASMAEEVRIVRRLDDKDLTNQQKREILEEVVHKAFEDYIKKLNNE